MRISVNGIVLAGCLAFWSVVSGASTVSSHAGATDRHLQQSHAAALLDAGVLVLSAVPAPVPAPTPAPEPTPTPAPTPAPPAPAAARVFPGAAADWLYSAPTGTASNISTMTAGLTFAVNAHDHGFDYPVQSTDGSLGCTPFTDTLYYNLSDQFCVPNVAGGFAPSVGAYGANDGHLVVINTSTGVYYDFWKLTVTTSGMPESTNVGRISSGVLATGSGVPGTTASGLTGLAGVILPGELDCETCLQHALSIVVPSAMNSNAVGDEAPAVKTDGLVPGAVFREGAKIRFDPSVNVDSLNASTAVKAIMTALQQYGGVITDQTSGTAVGIYSALATAPDQTGINLIGQHLLIYY